MPLDDFQFELGGVTFGRAQLVGVSRFERAGADRRSQDQPSGFGDYVVFGTDRKTPGLWSWDLFTNRRNAVDALATLELLEAAWDQPEVRATPQAVVALRYGLAGRTRRLYGRPQGFTPVPSTLVRRGLVAVVADFQPSHLGSFDDELLSASLSLGATTQTSGVTFPTSFPVLWGASVPSPRHVTVNVGGTRDTYLSAQITAGAEILSDPYVIVAGRSVETVGTVAPGETVLISGFPWAAQVTRADGTAASLTLAAGARLADLTVPPGQHEVSFGGIDGSGTASCVVSWRDAYHSI